MEIGIKYTGLLATSRKALLQAKEQIRAPVRMAGWPDLMICLPCCGQVRAWPRYEDLPDYDVGPCECGNWFIRYTERKQEDGA